MNIDTQHFKELLEIEKATLEKELETVGRKNPENPSDWEATENEDTDGADSAEVADSISTFDNHNSILDQLETRMNEVTKALDRISDGTYGMCEVCDGPIEVDRLEANPAASTCKMDMN